jgi:hypothetical protein
VKGLPAALGMLLDSHHRGRAGVISAQPRSCRLRCATYSALKSKSIFW